LEKLATIRTFADRKRAYSSKHGRSKDKVKKSAELFRNYGITIDQYDELLRKQNNECACCGRHITAENKALAVDHHHGLFGIESVRGLLCNRCNLGLGYLGDDIEGLELALEYLKKYYRN
jgi:hypothetical protein